MPKSRRSRSSSRRTRKRSSSRRRSGGNALQAALIPFTLVAANNMMKGKKLTSLVKIGGKNAEENQEKVVKKVAEDADVN